MKERQHPAPQDLRGPGAAEGISGGEDRLVAARNELDALSAAADRILGRLSTSESQYFLTQVRQSGGE